MMSILFTVVLGDTMYLYSQKILGPAKALAITTTTPFFTMMFSIFFLEYSITFPVIFSGILIALGVIIITKSESKLQNHNLENKSSQSIRKKISKTLIGVIIALATAISWAVGIALSDYSINQVDQILNLGILSTMIAMMVRFLFASFSLSILVMIEKGKTPIPKNRYTWYILIISALLSYSLGSIFFGEAVHIIGGTFMSLISTALPLFTIPFSYIINREKISKKEFLGILLTLIGITLLILFPSS
jgi:drug/metabolite transporter (DMT)-like permease